MNRFDPEGFARRIASIRCRSGIAAFAALAVFLCCGATSPTGCQNSNPGTIGPSAGEVIGAAVGVGAGIAVVTVLAVEHSRHTLTGCALAGPNGILLKTGSTLYAIQGDANGVKAGEKVKVHGSRARKTTDPSGNRVFVVEEVRKDYGPCQANIAQSSSTGSAQ